MRLDWPAENPSVACAARRCSGTLRSTQPCSVADTEAFLQNDRVASCAQIFYSSLSVPTRCGSQSDTHMDRQVNRTKMNKAQTSVPTGPPVHLRIERDRWFAVMGLVDCSITMSELPHSS